MRIKKRGTFGLGTVSEDAKFVRVGGRRLRISAAVRDWILPYKHVGMEINDEGNLILIPTNDSNEYKLVISSSGETAISASQYVRYRLATTERIPCVKQKDGTILCKIK